MLSEGQSSAITLPGKSSGLMIDDGVGNADGNGANNFYRVYMTQAVFGWGLSQPWSSTGPGAGPCNHQRRADPTLRPVFTGLKFDTLPALAGQPGPLDPGTITETGGETLFTGGSIFSFYLDPGQGRALWGMDSRRWRPKSSSSTGTTKQPLN
jgi:hypothetical protein